MNNQNNMPYDMISEAAVQPNLEVKVRARGIARAADLADLLAGPDWTTPYRDDRQVGVQRLSAIIMTDDNPVAIRSLPSCCYHYTRVHCKDGSALRCGKIKAHVATEPTELLCDRVTVEGGAVLLGQCRQALRL